MSEVGRAFLLQLHLGDGTYQTLAGQLTTSFSISNQPIDVTDKDDSRWRKLIEGGPRELELAGQGLISDEDSYLLLRDAAATGALNNYRVIFASGQSFESALQVVSFDGEGGYDDAERYSLSLASADEVAVNGEDTPNVILDEMGDEILDELGEPLLEES